MIIFDNLWRTMNEKGVTTYMLREQHGIDSRTIRRLRANQNVTVYTIDKLCRILECDVMDIISYLPDQSAE